MEKQLENSSVDMTLALAADSYLREKQRGFDLALSDPTGRECFITLVDLAVNSDSFYMPEPSTDDYADLPIFVNRLKRICPLHRCADVQLSDETERSIFEVFWSLVEKKKDTLAQWFRSQLHNPHVLRFHQVQAEGSRRTFATFTDQTWELWISHGGITRSSNIEPLIRTVPSREYLTRDIKNAGGVSSHQLCYVYEVFRRGWQYAQATRLTNLNIYYWPHPLREHALAAGGHYWLETQRELYWSWGRCMAYAIDHAHEPVSASEIVSWINGLSDAKILKWRRAPKLDEETDTPERKRELRALIEHLFEWARAAGIPQQPMKQSLVVHASEIISECIREQHHIGVISRVLTRLPVHGVLKPVASAISETGKDGINYFLRGTFGYPSLIGPGLENAAAPESSAVTLI